MHRPLDRAGARLTLIAVAGAATLGLTAAPAAAGGLPTTTTLGTSVTTIDATQSTAITATIRPGVLAGPRGVVTFTDATNATTLGTASPALGCLLRFKPCAMTITVPGTSLASGANTIVGQYAGDAVQAPSQGSVSVYEDAGPTTCTAALDPSGCAAFAASADGTASADISSDAPASGIETVAVAFGTQELPCSTSGTGDLVAFTVTNAGGYKSIRYDVYGQAADTAQAAHPAGYLCYESAAPFTTASGQPAAQEPDGSYDGSLPFCTGGAQDVPATNEPCIDYASYVPASESESGVSDYTVEFQTDAADPRATN